MARPVRQLALAQKAFGGNVQRGAFGLTMMILLGAAASALAQVSDVKGSNDHPLVSRYAKSVIIGYDFRKFDEFVIPLGVLKRAGDRPAAGGGTHPTFEPAKSQRVEGRVTRILYVGPPDRSPLEIVRNYELELKKNGFETIYTCAAAQCGEQDGWLAEFYLYTLDKRLSQTPPRGSGRVEGQISEYALSSPINQRYLAAKRSRPEGDVYVSVYVATNRATHHKETQDHPVILLDVVDAVPIETGMVTIDAAAMAKDISSTGHVALYGIYFDTDKWDLKPESQPTLQEIAKLLKKDPSLRLYIVGHTDTVGGFDYNVGLSERRAAAVVKELTAKHGIAAVRLKPAGVGMLAPVAPNDTEQGRAKNRRVELVRQ
jgi:outer membrane protein OmpA-like peptidoglycan-associated protein